MGEQANVPSGKCRGLVGRLPRRVRVAGSKGGAIRRFTRRALGMFPVDMVAVRGERLDQELKKLGKKTRRGKETNQEGVAVGRSLGSLVGVWVGLKVGSKLGSLLGEKLGECVGCSVGTPWSVGATVWLISSVGADVVGACVGFLVGGCVGSSVGNSVGVCVGWAVGASVTNAGGSGARTPVCCNKFIGDIEEEVENPVPD